MRAGGGTTLCDAAFLAAEEKLKTAIGRIVVIADGDDTASKMRQETLKNVRSFVSRRNWQRTVR
jgi:hypothetical protein